MGTFNCEPTIMNQLAEVKVVNSSPLVKITLLLRKIIMNSPSISSKESNLSLPVYAGFLQVDVLKGSCAENKAKVKDFLASLSPPPGAVVVLPELWSDGFLYETLDLQTEKTEALLAELVELAATYQICVAGSLPEKEIRQQEACFYNTLYFCGPDGVLGKYRKQQLFGPMEEDLYFSQGESPRPVLTPWGMMAGLVCFDLRFPELAACQVAQGASLLLVSAQWPAARKNHWRILIQARAIENQAYVVACNRCGTTGDTGFAGHSMIVAPDGTIVAEAGDGEEYGGASLDSSLVTKIRSRFHTAGRTPYRFSDSEKICDLAQLVKKAANYKKSGRKMVFTNGCFDILHEGHVTYLEAARKEGDYLVVGLNSDASIRAIKGPDRPVNSETSRARLLAALGCVDHVVIFSEETPHRLITTLMPDVLVRGADWPVEKIVGAKEVLASGGEVKTIELVGDFSTTGLIKKIRSK